MLVTLLIPEYTHRHITGIVPCRHNLDNRTGHTRRYQAVLRTRIVALDNTDDLSCPKLLTDSDPGPKWPAVVVCHVTDPRCNIQTLCCQRPQQAIEDIAQQAWPERHRQGRTGPGDDVSRTQAGGVLIDLDYRIGAIESNDFTEQLLLADQRRLVNTERACNRRAQHRATDPGNGGIGNWLM